MIVSYSYCLSKRCSKRGSKSVKTGLYKLLVKLTLQYTEGQSIVVLLRGVKSFYVLGIATYVYDNYLDIHSPSNTIEGTAYTFAPTSRCTFLCIAKIYIAGCIVQGTVQ